MLELEPDGFEERQRGDELELAAYTDSYGGARIARAFGKVHEEALSDDWAEKWRTFHQPVRAGPFWIGPSWEGAPDDAIAIVIDPGLAFGTGAHATTRLCLELLAGLAHGSFLDAGCGSGVLSVAAAKVGYAPVYALDDDRFAVETATANATSNHVAIEARLADVTRDPLPPVDVAVANIALAAAETVAAHVTAANLVTSGYLLAERPDANGWDHVERRELEGWAADRWRPSG
jgi:ribosomal protein L11 methyltransferase